MEKNTKILICNESTEERRHIAEIFTKRGVRRPDECADGANSLTIAKKLSYDVVITDLWMTGLDGIGIIRALKQQCPETAMVLLSPFSTTFL